MTELNSYELCSKHDTEDKCAMCQGFLNNWDYNYGEIYKYYQGHLRHLYVYDYMRFGKIEQCKNVVRCYQYNGLLGKDAMAVLWTIKINNKGSLVFSRVGS